MTFAVALSALVCGFCAFGIGVSADRSIVAGKMRYDRWHNDYCHSMVYKIMLKSKSKPNPHTTIDDALKIVRMIHDLSGGMHQIVYLVGWQHLGHDSKFPDWGRVGDHCKSSYSKDPLASLRAMMRDARKLNADVSLHINMNDAYTNSPLWSTYCANKLLCIDKHGRFCSTGVWDGEESYGISHLKEWNSGYAQKRILGLLEMIPELKESHTVHIDALFGLASLGDDINEAADIEAIDKIVDFWHQNEIDVTTEFLPALNQVGYFPMVYHYNVDERYKIIIPPDLLCGGDSAWNTRNQQDYYNKIWKGMMPLPGCVYEEAWGEGHWGDLVSSDLRDVTKLIRLLFSRTFLFVYYNQARPISHVIDGKFYRVKRSNGVESCVDMVSRILTVSDNGRMVVSDGDYCLDFPYGGGTLLLYSARGCSRSVQLPRRFKGATEFSGLRYPEGEKVRFEVKNGEVVVELKAGASAVLHADLCQ